MSEADAIKRRDEHPAFGRHTPDKWLAREAARVVAGGQHSLVGTPGTLDHHLKACLGTDVARWLTRVLHDAGLVEVDEGSPLRLRPKSSR